MKKPRALGNGPRACMLILVCLAGSVCAERAEDFASANYAAGAAEYLKIPAHAHAAGLGNAVSAWRGQIAGARLNPAILDAVDSLGVMAAYTLMTLDRKMMAMDVSCPLGHYLVAGLSITSLSVENIEGRDEFGAETGMFGNKETAVAASIAGRTRWEIAFGLTARYLHQMLENQRANGIGFDAGATWMPFPRLCFGVSVGNVFSRLWWSTGHSDPVLSVARFGAVARFLDSAFTVGIDFAKTLQQPLETTAGLQYTLWEVFSLRAGIATGIRFSEKDYREPDISLGAGIKLSFLSADYAISLLGSDLGASHKFSVHRRFAGIRK